MDRSLGPPSSARSGDSASTGETSRGADALALPKLQSLLADAVQRLAERTLASRALGWTPVDATDEGAPDSYRVTAAYGTANAAALSREDLVALAELGECPEPVDLAAPPSPSSAAALAKRHGVSCAARVASHDGSTIAWLLLGGESDPPGSVRPRTLAALGHTVERLRTPATAALAALRLARVDDEVRHLNQLATLGDLVAEVVHEVRNPLVSMKTFLQLLPDHLDDPEFHGGFREVVLEELQRMERLINTLIRQSRPSATPDPLGADAGETLLSIERLLGQRCADRNIRLTVQVASDLPMLAIGEDRLRQLILNLVLNAVEATPENGRVVLRARPDATDGGGVVLSVDDSGPGIAPESRERLFEPFVSTRTQSSGGLGLAICKRIVGEVGGDIRIGDSPEGGARFEVRLGRL